MIVNLNSTNGQKNLLRFKEIDHQRKFESFFKKHNYEVALVFAKN